MKSVLDLQKMPLPERLAERNWGPEPSNLSVALCIVPGEDGCSLADLLRSTGAAAREPIRAGAA